MSCAKGFFSAYSRPAAKARSLPADALILDLEDAVAPDAKEAARAQVCDAVKAKAFGKREIVVRINALSTSWGEADLSAAAVAKPDAILVANDAAFTQPSATTVATLRHAYGVRWLFADLKEADAASLGQYAGLRYREGSFAVYELSGT